MKDIIKTATSYVNAGYWVIPVSHTKEPSIGNWRQFQKRVMTHEEIALYFNGATHIGLLCGGQPRVVCVDVDTKYDIHGTLWTDFTDKIPESIKEKVMCQRTQNGGYHLVFKVPSSCLNKNEKLASRYTTPGEKHETYMEAWLNPATKDIAHNILQQDKSRILIETRSGTAEACGGYFVTYPSPGYKLVHGKIGELTEDEYELVFEAARSLNQVVSEDRSIEKKKYSGKWAVTPFDDYDENGDVVNLLLEYGWQNSSPLFGRRNIDFIRPGKTYNKKSAMLDTDTRIFNVFSTSTLFDVNRGYRPSSLFISLVHEGDIEKAYNDLIGKGYGKKE